MNWICVDSSLAISQYALPLAFPSMHCPSYFPACTSQAWLLSVT